MEKILLMSDSACDIPQDLEKELGLRIINLDISYQGEPLEDRVDFTPENFYQLLNTCKELPTTAGITPIRFMEEFWKASQEGYTHILYVSINGKGSNTLNNCRLAIQELFQNRPELVGKLTIDAIDGKAYSLGYGYPLIRAAKKLKEGMPYQQLKEFLVQAIDETQIYTTFFTLKFAKRSGRLGSTAAFVGDLLGLRPILSFPDGENMVLEKVRGDKGVLHRIAELYRDKGEGRDFVMLYGEDRKPADELCTLIEEMTGKKPEYLLRTGSCIAINSGPNMVGIAFPIPGTK